MDRLERNFVKELAEASKRIDKKLSVPKPRYDEVISIERKPDTPVEVAEEMQIPMGESYAIWRRSNLGSNKRVFYNLPLNEAKHWTLELNRREQNKRSNMAVIPEEVFLFDYAAHNSAAEDPYWNPPVLTKSDFDKPEIMRTYEDLH